MKMREGSGTWVLAFWTLCVCTSAWSQNETSASLFGEVVSAHERRLVRDAEVSLHHTSTSAVYRTRVNSSGHFSFGGLRVDGPYELTVSSAGFSTAILREIHLQLGEHRGVEVVLTRSTDDAVSLEKLVVTASRPSASRGAHTVLAEEDIDTVPSVERSLNEYARTDPRVVLIDGERGELGAAGQNGRFNSIQIDGIRINDQFGITPNGVPSQGNPFSLETLQAIAIELSPYEVNRSGFTGAAVNAVTRSGTNEYGGSLYYTYRDQNYRAKNPSTGERTRFTDETYSATLGGPVVKNRLFFFAAYEHSERTEPAPSAGFEPTADALQRIFSTARLYNHDPGVLENPGQQRKQDDKYLAKLDWNLNSQHRLSVRYSETRGNEPIFVDYSTSGRVSLSGHWYDSQQNLTAWSGQLFSQWHAAFRTDFKIAHHKYDAIRSPRSYFPQVRINGVPGADGGTGSVFLGTDDISQMNDLSVENAQASLSASWLLGRHQLMWGCEIEQSDFENTYIQNGWGSYSFSNIDNFALGKPSAFTYQYLLPGQSPTVAWGYALNSAFLQDTWKISPRFSVTAGLRFDYPTVNRNPEYNPLVDQTFGRRNDHTIDGARVFAPRASFSWRPTRERRVEVRGGAGLFQGRAPGVWMSNAYSNDGQSTLVNTSISNTQFSPDPRNQPKGNPGTQRQRVDLMDRNFHLPSVARANLAVDYHADWQRLVFSAEALQSWTVEGLAYRNLNLRRTGTGPDGRAIYGTRTTSLALTSNSQHQSTAFTDVYLLTNTSKGDATQLTFRVRRPLQNHWAAAFAYTRGRAREVSPVTSSTAATNFSARAGIDPNGDELGTANTEIRDRVLASLTFRFSPLKKLNTKLTVAYEGRSGRPYSFVFNSDVNGDSADYDNDLFYVPSGRNDPIVRWSDPAQAEAFFAYLASNPALQRFAGQIVPRNSERSRYQHQVDLRFSQEVSLWRSVRAEFFCDILNFGNLLNDRWGRVHQVGFPYVLAVATANYDPKTNQYVYRFTSPPRPQPLQAAASRWQIQMGTRLKF
jgi:outer membrane receptor for ferrienterochelin and colicin